MNHRILNGATVGTFVIDSHAALAAWANHTPGNDYTSVVVKSGTWTSDKRIHLGETGTKAVIGEGGSILAFTCPDGLGYDFESWGPKNPTSDYFIVGITVHMIHGGNAFTSCCNLTGCHAVGIPITYSMAFFECQNVINCSAVSFWIGFDNTLFITNCYAKDCNYGYNEGGLQCNCQAVNCGESYRDAGSLVNCM
ncbi:MAG: hypothetical protein LUD68_07180 [Rikenellaceae bacterium]|nr:hypothetical protein [Rikenellaceae bacterium]